MLYRAGLHEQLGSIMDKLAKAAVTEICRVVDDGYAVLRLEVSQKQKENEDLKGKLKMLELILAQEYRETCGTSQRGAVGSCSNAAALQVSGGAHFASKGVDVGVWREGLCSLTGGTDTPLQPLVADQHVDDRKPECLLIKEEDVEEGFGNQVQHVDANIGQQRTERIPQECQNTVLIVNEEHQSGQQGIVYDFLENSRLETHRTYKQKQVIFVQFPGMRTGDARDRHLNCSITPYCSHSVPRYRK